MTLVTRTDRVSLASAGLKPAEVTADGFLRVDAYLFRGGVLEYRRADGTVRREYRDPEAVLAPEVLAAHQLLPLSNSHPLDLVRPDSAKREVVGTVGQDVRRDGNRARATIVIYDAGAIADVRAGKQELSVGYRCQIDETPGVTPTGERYDARQHGWVPNHVAIEHRGRAGDAVMRVDHADECVVDENKEPAPASAQKEKIEMTEEEKKALAEAQAALAAALARADAAEKALVEERAKRLDGASVEKIRAEVKARLALEQRALDLCGEESFPTDRKDSAGKQVADRFDGLKDRDLMVAIIKRVDGEDVAPDLADSVVTGFYLSAVKRADRGRSDREALAARHVPITSNTTSTAPAPSKNADELRADALAKQVTIYGAKKGA